jgi:hypothetical protein
MYKNITRISFIILFISLTSCKTCSQKPQLIQEKLPLNQEEELKSEIKKLELERKKQITQLMDEWYRTKPLNGSEKIAIIQQGDIEEIYTDYTNHINCKTEAEIKEKLKQLKDEAEAEQKKKDYSDTTAQIAILEKDLYKFYESYFLAICVKKNKKQGVDVYFKRLEEKEKNGTLKLSRQKKQLQLLRNWKAVEPILKLEQEKREALKKLQEANKS